VIWVDIAGFRQNSPDRIAAWRCDLAWMDQHALPWLWRTATGGLAGHRRVAKRPVLEPVRTA
jgi:hypothetical protein